MDSSTTDSSSSFFSSLLVPWNSTTTLYATTGTILAIAAFSWGVGGGGGGGGGGNGFFSFGRGNRRRRRTTSTTATIEPIPRHGGDVVAEVLVKHGVSFIFCLTGGHISPILVGCKRRGIRVIDVRHEATAVFAADAVSRVSSGSQQQVGVACVTAGPGVTNTLTAIQNAYMAQSPLVVLGGATLGLLKGKGSLQDIDQLSLVRDIVKWKTTVSKVCDIIPKLEEAFFRATSNDGGIPGPVFVELPLDVLYPEQMIREQVLAKFQGKTGIVNTITRLYLEHYLNRMYGGRTGGGVEAQGPSQPWKAESQVASETSIRKAVSMLLKAKRPVMVIGSQAVLLKKDFLSNSSTTSASSETKNNNSSNNNRKNPPVIEEVLQAIRNLRIPVFLAGGARGCLGRENKNNDDSSGCKLHIRHKRSAALKQADVVLLMGVPCDFRLNYGFVFRKTTKLISVNLDKQQLYLNKRPTLPIHGEVPDFLIRLSERLFSSSHKQQHCRKEEEEKDHNDPQMSQLAKDWESWRLQLQNDCDKRDAEIRQQSQIKLPAQQQQQQQGNNNNTMIPVCNPLSICLSLDECLRSNSILVCDGGDFIGTAAYTIRPHRELSWLDPGPFGTLGVGAGFALGAKLVRPDADVWLLWGDGSAAYSIMEYDTFIRHNVNIIGLIGNDACWRQIHRDQIQTLEDDVGCMLAYSDYHKVGRVLGGMGYLVTNEGDMKPTIQKAYEESKSIPVLINALIGKTNFRDGSISV